MTRLSRRHALLGGLTLAAVAACSEKPVLADPAEPVPPINERIDALERRHNALIGVFAVDLDSGRSVAHRAEDLFAMCSTFKGYAAARVLQMTQDGQLTLDQKVFVDPAGLVPNSPRTVPRAGGDMTLDELCRAAVQVSDNTAGNLLLKTIGGPQAITAFARSIGDDRTRLDRWETELNSAIPGDPRDTSTPEALGGGYRNLLAGDALAPPNGSSWTLGSGPTRRRASGQASRRAGRPLTRPGTATTPARTTSESHTGPIASAFCLPS